MHNQDEPYHRPKTVDDKLDDIIVLTKETYYLVSRLKKRIYTMSAQLDHLTSAVTNLVKEVEEASVEIAKLAQAVRDAASDPTAIEALATQIDAQAKALDDAVAAAEAPASVAPTQ